VARAIGRKLKAKVALELAASEGSRPDETYSATNPGLVAFVLADGRYLTQLTASGQWGVWPSLEAYRALMASVVSGRSIDPVIEAIGNATEFVQIAPDLAKQLVVDCGVSVSSALTAEDIEAVDRCVMSKSVAFWLENRLRLRKLIAFVGEVLRRETPARWCADRVDGAVLVTSSGEHIFRVGRVVVAVGDEAAKGEFSLGDVLDELRRGHVP
jgi:hypothetical protein